MNSQFLIDKLDEFNKKIIDLKNEEYHSDINY